VKYGEYSSLALAIEVRRPVLDSVKSRSFKSVLRALHVYALDVARSPRSLYLL
jgi:hypothetical protein